MSKEITKAIILQEIQDKFKLREFEPTKFLFDETVVPTYNVESHLKRMNQKFNTVSITSTGAVFFFAAAMDEVWHVRLYDVVFMTGVYTIAGVYLTRARDHGAGESIYLDLGAAKSSSYHVDLNTPIRLEPSDALYINVDGFTSVGDLRLYIDYEVEEVR